MGYAIPIIILLLAMPIGLILKHYTKDELEGKKCIVFCNLEPRTIKGIESKGMILAVVNDDQSEIKLLQPDGVVELGSRVS